MSRILVLGAGVSGLAAARLARRLGAGVSLYDQHAEVPALEAGFGIASGEWDPHLLEGVDLVVASPGFSERSRPVVDTIEAGLPIWSEIEFAWRHIDSPVIAVTGTNGKTTVTETAAAMLQASGLDAPAAGNVGYPLSDFAGRRHDLLVVETSSFQLRFIDTFHPIEAAITNVAVDHLDWHGSTTSYETAKSRIFENQTSEDLLVYDAEDPGAARLARTAPSRLYPVSGTGHPPGGGGVDHGKLVVDELTIDLDDIPSHHSIDLTNLVLAAALALHAGASPEAVRRVATQFQPGPHRRSVVAETGGVRWVNDSKATNPHAALASIGNQERVILIAGGRNKGLDVSELASHPNVKMLLGIGEAGEELVAAAGARGRLAGTLEAAVKLAAEVAEPGDTVLLAPGCASFDQFRSYEERGERFVALVTEMTGGETV